MSTKLGLVLRKFNESSDFRTYRTNYKSVVGTIAKKFHLSDETVDDFFAAFEEVRTEGWYNMFDMNNVVSDIKERLSGTPLDEIESMSSSVMKNFYKEVINNYSKVFKSGSLDEAGGQDAGKVELDKISLKDAVEVGEEIFKKYGRDLHEELPNFEKNFNNIQKLLTYGKTQRKDMPVIDTDQIHEFQRKLLKGELDVVTNKSNPFPEGLSGAEAKKWLEAGLKKYDGDEKDDIVSCKIKDVKVSDLKPIQKQIYFDKSMNGTAEFGAEGTRKFLKEKSILIASSDLFIIDGHHRWSSANLLDKDMKVPVLVIDLPIKTLLPLSLAYGDAIGNKRNA